PDRPRGHPRGHDPRRLRRRRAHRAPRGERHGPLPRASRVQGRREVRRLPQGQRDRRADGRLAERLHVARSRRLPHHRPRRGGDGRARPPDRLRRAPADRRRGARPRARRRDPGDPALQGPAVDGRRGAHRRRGVRRPPARAQGARPRGAPAHVHPLRDRRVPLAPVGRRGGRRVHRRQPGPRARRRPGRRAVRALPHAARAGGLRARAPGHPGARDGRGARHEPVAPADDVPAADRRHRLRTARRDDDLLDAARRLDGLAPVRRDPRAAGPLLLRLGPRPLVRRPRRARPRRRPRLDQDRRGLHAHAGDRQGARRRGADDRGGRARPRVRGRPPRPRVREHERGRALRGQPDDRLRRVDRPRRRDRAPRRGHPRPGPRDRRRRRRPPRDRRRRPALRVRLREL
ncbi:MAG: Ubiquinol-cytochrome C reductase complex core protein I, mitochondrial precursor, partial [uncultured Solirubrobacteraceae bacterium]